MKTRILATGSNSATVKPNAGFTLVELLVVIAIVGILTGLATLSVDLSKPSVVARLKAKIQNHIVSMQNHSQLYNKPIRLLFDADKMQPLTLVDGSSWEGSAALPILAFDSVAVSADVDTIEILPNGFVTEALITLSKDDDSDVLNSKTDER